jgi:hypothetical protein
LPLFDVRERFNLDFEVLEASPSLVAAGGGFRSGAALVGCYRVSRKLVTCVHKPATCNSQTHTTTTTTTFRIVLMLEAMGINLLINHSATPTTINTTTMFIKGIIFCSSRERRSNPLPNRQCRL